MVQDLTERLPAPFVWRRIQSLAGLWLVIFLIEHMITNSQAALFFADGSNGFVRAVNFLHNLPYLHVIEVVLLGLPIVVHAALGFSYLFSSRPTVTGGAQKPKVSRGRNWAYTWQRATSWILLIGIILHVWYMRFATYPEKVRMKTGTYYFVRLNADKELKPLAERLGVELYDGRAIEGYAKGVGDNWEKVEFLDRGLKSRSLEGDQVMAVGKNFGDLILLNVREAFKSWFKAVLYTIFVLAAAFHGFNGLWTFMITWGVVIRVSAQKKMVRVCVALMCLFGALGLMSIWGTYFFNLRG
ncbi:MAG: hypothetical protein S4CHLAM102_07090 [Chlamydiia bacterium]|nr:hypothetical protein [Chlamydiia bacterium]